MLEVRSSEAMFTCAKEVRNSLYLLFMMIVLRYASSQKEEHEQQYLMLGIVLKLTMRLKSMRRASRMSARARGAEERGKKGERMRCSIVRD